MGASSDLENGSKAETPLILITNDDGVSAPGIRALQAALRPFGRVVVVAPDRERSAASHSISLDRPLRVDELEEDVFAVDGTPVDCVYLAILHLCGRKPDLCVSGVNDGYNLGSDVFYSGTVAGAVEGALREVPSIAVSMQRTRPHDFSAAAELVSALVQETLQRGPKQAIPASTLLNVNVPAGPLYGFQVTFLGRRVYRDQVDARQDLRGRSYYWIGGPEENATDLPGSDCSAVRTGYASVTPLGLDLTHRGQFAALTGWDLANFVQKAVEHAKNPP